MDYLLAELFGDGWANLILSNDISENQNVLGAMFAIFNLFVVIVTTAVLFLVTLSAIADSAHKNQALGSRYSELWWPARSVMTFVLLVPAIKGYSILQVLILTFAVAVPQEIATDIGAEAVEAIANKNVALTRVQLPDSEEVPGQMLGTAVCMVYHERAFASLPGIDARIDQITDPVIVEGGNFFSTEYYREINFNGNRASGMGDNACGSYKVTTVGDSDAEAAIVQTKINALNGLYLRMRPVAEAIIDTDIDQKAFYPEFINARVGYENGLRTAASQQLNFTRAGSDDTSILGLPADESRSVLTERLVEDVADDWANLGRWYATLTSINMEQQAAGDSRISFRPMENSRSIFPDSGLADKYDKTDAFIVGANVTPNSAPSARDLEELAEAAQLTDGRGYINTKLTGNRQPTHLFGIDGTRGSSAFSYGEEPLSGLQDMGNVLVTGTSALFGLSVAFDWLSELIFIKKAGKVAATVFDKVTSKKGKKTRGKSAANAIGGGGSGGNVSDLVFYLGITLFFLGIVLLYYLPMVPFIIWSFAIMGYLIFLLEALMAAPLWAASHAMPDGDGIRSEGSKQGYNLILSLAIRPPIMVMSLFMAAALMNVMAGFVTEGFEVQAAGLMAGRFDLTGIITYTALLVIEISVIVAVVHKTHSMMVDAGEEVAKWITSITRSNDASNTERSIFGAVDRTGRTAESAGQRGVGAGGRSPRLPGGGGSGAPLPPVGGGNRALGGGGGSRG